MKNYTTLVVMTQVARESALGVGQDAHASVAEDKGRGIYKELPQVGGKSVLPFNP